MSKTCSYAGCERGCYGEFCLIHKPRKPIITKKRPKQRGRRSQIYEEWKADFAIPYLDQTFGHRCVDCGADQGLDVAHIIGRGRRPDLKMDLENVNWKCRSCHQAESGIYW